MQDEAQSSQSGTGLDLYHSGSHDHARHLALDSQSRFLIFLLIYIDFSLPLGVK